MLTYCKGIHVAYYIEATCIPSQAMPSLIARHPCNDCEEHLVANVNFLELSQRWSITTNVLEFTPPSFWSQLRIAVFK